MFAPCRNLGIIILDEEQEHSYKSENTPRYCAREVAIFRGTGRRRWCFWVPPRLPWRPCTGPERGCTPFAAWQAGSTAWPFPRSGLVDMKEGDPGRQRLRDQPSPASGYGGDHGPRESRPSLFLNRRGASRMLQCVSCGQVPECPWCSVHLTYHSANHRLMCHYCGFSQPVPQRCPQCGGPLKQVGPGPKRFRRSWRPASPVSRWPGWMRIR